MVVKVSFCTPLEFSDLCIVKGLCIEKCCKNEYILFPLSYPSDISLITFAIVQLIFNGINIKSLMATLKTLHPDKKSKQKVEDISF